MHDVEVVFVAAVLEHLLAGIHLGPRNQRRPRPRPRRRIGDGELVVDRVGGHAREALGDRERRGIGPLKDHAFLGLEVRRLDDQRRAFPAAAGIAEPLPQVLVEMRAPVDRNDPGAVDHLGSNGHVAGTLEDLEVVVVDRRQIRRHVGPDDAANRPGHVGVVVRQAGGEPCGGLGTRGAHPLALGRQRGQHRNPSVNRIHDERRASVGGDLQAPRVHPVLVVGAIDVGGVAAVAPIARQIVGERLPGTPRPPRR